MPGKLTNVAIDFFAALDAMDADRMMQAVTEDAQSVDEVSRRWLRGGGEVANYVRQLMATVRSSEFDHDGPHVAGTSRPNRGTNYTN